MDRPVTLRQFLVFPSLTWAQHAHSLGLVLWLFACAALLALPLLVPRGDR